MNEELEAAMSYLIAEGYVSKVGDNYVFTNKFYLRFTGRDVGIVTEVVGVKTESVIIVNPKKGTEIEKAVPQWKEADFRAAYLRFIDRCKVPRRVQTPEGLYYDTNKFSIEGLTGFKKLMLRVSSGEVDYELVIKAVQLYYASGNRYKLKIGNYMKQGSWETDYLELKENLEKGEEHLKGHIKRETDDGHFTRFRE